MVCIGRVSQKFMGLPEVLHGNISEYLSHNNVMRVEQCSKNMRDLYNSNYANYEDNSSHLNNEDNSNKSMKSMKAISRSQCNRHHLPSISEQRQKVDTITRQRRVMRMERFDDLTDQCSTQCMSMSLREGSCRLGLASAISTGCIIKSCAASFSLYAIILGGVGAFLCVKSVVVVCDAAEEMRARPFQLLPNMTDEIRTSLLQQASCHDLEGYIKIKGINLDNARFQDLSVQQVLDAYNVSEPSVLWDKVVLKISACSQQPVAAVEAESIDRS